MARQKQRPRKIVARKNTTSVPNSDFSSFISSPVPVPIPETPQKQDTTHALNGNANVPSVPPSSPLSSSPPTSPATPSLAGVKKDHVTDQDDLTALRPSSPSGPALTQVNDSDEGDPSDTPKAQPRRSKRTPTSAKVGPNVDDIPADNAIDDAASSTSSKRKFSPAMDDPQDTPTVTGRPKRLRNLQQDTVSPRLHDEDFQPPYTPLTSSERSSWKGWVEIESEPVHVNAMLRDLGVRGVRAQEVFTLDPDETAKFEQPVYGLIFLFQYQDSDHITQGEECPKDIWFSNQLPATYSCATVALLNALMNAQGVELGKPLMFFKEDTMELTPMERAHCVNEHEFIRGVHNSFASRVDMWNADRIFAEKHKKAVQAYEKRLRDEERERVKFEKAAKAKEDALNNPSTPIADGKPKRSKRPRKKEKKKDQYCDDTSSGDDIEADSPAATKSTYDDESGHHYVAYLPLNGHVWRMDGMSSYPQDLGAISDSEPWLKQAGEHIQARMLEFDGAGVLFNLMALVKDPVERHREELARCVNKLVEVEKRLDGVQSGWRDFAEELGEEVLRGADEEMGVTTLHLSSITPPLTTPSSSSTPTEKLLQQRTELARDQESLKEMIRIQNVKVANEMLKVAKDRLDLNPMIHQVLLDLEEDGVIQELMSTFKE